MQRTIKVNVDFSSSSENFPHFWETVMGSEGADFPLRNDLLSHYEMVKNDFNTQYIRFHGILHDNLNLYNEDKQGNPKLNFEMVDKLYDNLLNIGIKPFVELSFMPEKLASKDTHIFYWRANTSPPKDYKKWESLVKAFVEHCIKRYGKKEVRKWYFEVWNEPNLKGFWSGTQEEYWELYRYTVKAIKDIDSYLKVGGPASAGGEWVKEILEYCSTNNIPIDFISYHGYPNDEGYIVGGKPFEFRGIDFWRELAKANYEIVKSFDKDDSIEIHITEWNLTSRVFDPKHDTSNGAAYCCQAINDVVGHVDSFSYWTVSDIFRELGFPKREFHGGFGLLTVHSLKKPKYWAFKLLNSLKGERISVSMSESIKGIGSIATKTRESLHIILWYYDPQWNSQAESVPIEIECINLPFRSISIVKNLVDESHSNITNIAIEKGIAKYPGEEELKEEFEKIVDKMKNLTKDSHNASTIDKEIGEWPTDEELEELKSLNVLYEERESRIIDNGVVNFDLILKPGSIVFLGIEKDS